MLPQSFGVDLPHLITSAQKEFVKQARSENKMFQLYYCLVNMDYECLFKKAINCCRPLYLIVKSALMGSLFGKHRMILLSSLLS